MALEKTIGIIIARMSSSRLPGKVLRPMVGRPLLDFTLERLQAVTGLSEIWLATTSHESDQPLIDWANQHGIQQVAYDGDINNVLGRISSVVSESGAQRFIGVLGDTPFVDSRLLNNMLAEMDTHPEWDSVCVEQSFTPCVHGGILCYRTEAWQRIDTASDQPMYREHAGSILRDQPDLITRGQLRDEPLYYTGPYRLTVDTPADFELANRLAETLHRPGEIFSLAEVLYTLQENPKWAQMNQHVRQKTHHESPPRVLMAIQAGGGFGLGHLSRCKTIGNALREQFSANVTLWLDSPSPDLSDTLSEDGWRVAPTGTALAETLKNGHYDRLVIDFQDSLSADFMKALRQAWPSGTVIVLDNNGEGCKLADTVIFPNAHALPDKNWSNGHPAVFSGPEYTLLGANFLAEAPKEQEQRGQPTFVLVTMGGVDPNLLTEHALKALCMLENCHIDLVVPPLYPNPEAIETMATTLPSTITLHWKRSNIRPLMQRAAVAIAAFGVTAYELAYMGVPTLLVGHDESQLEDIQRFATFGSALSLGAGQSIHPKKLYESLVDLLRHPEKLAEMSENGHKLVPDENGALRVSEKILAATPQALQH